jgi:hypothetical protein
LIEAPTRRFWVLFLKKVHEDTLNLLKKPLFTAAEAREVGFHPSLLSCYVKKGIIERIEPQIELDFSWGDLILAVQKVPSGDGMPRVHWVAVPHSLKAPERKGVKIVRMRNIKLGQSSL